MVKLPKILDNSLKCLVISPNYLNNLQRGLGTSAPTTSAPTTSAPFRKDTSAPRQDTSAPHEKTLRPLAKDTSAPNFSGGTTSAP